MSLQRLTVVVGMGFFLACLAETALPEAAAQTRRRKNVRIPVRPVPPHVKQAAEQRKQTLKQWNRDLAHWRGALKTAETESETERALYHLAVGYEQTGKWTAAIESLEKLRKDFPESPWRPAATVRLFDLMLERNADVAAARQLKNELQQWADDRRLAAGDKRVEPTKPAATNTNETASRTETPANVLEPPANSVTVSAAYWRSLLLSYLEGDRAAAMKLWRQAGPVPPTAKPADELRRRWLTRVAYFVRTGTQPMPQQAAEGDADARVLLGLAHLQLMAGDTQRPQELCGRVVGRGSAASGEQQSYARFLRGRCYFAATDLNTKKRSRGEYLAAVRLAPQADWAGEATFLAANIWWNFEQNMDEAVKLWDKVLDDYPQNRAAPRAAYHIGIAYESGRRYREADAAFTRLKTLYPNSSYLKLAEEHQQEIARKLR